MLDSRQILALEQRLEEAHEELSRDWDKQGMSRVAAHDTLDRIEGLLADLDELREAKVYQRQPDEPYMESYDEGLYQADEDEPYMDSFRGEAEDSSEMMEEFGGSEYHQVEAQNTDDHFYDEEEPHEHMREEAPDYHIDDDTGVNDDMQEKFGEELCEKCRRREARRR